MSQTPATVTYTTLQPGEEVQLTRDYLQGIERDHFRLSLAVASGTSGPADETRLAQLAQGISNLNGLLKQYEAAVNPAPAPSPPASAASSAASTPSK